MMSVRTMTLKRPAINTPWSDRTAIKFAMIAAGVLLGFLYVVQINLTATKGYEIRELERTLSSLQQQSQVLRLQSLELQSMERLQVQAADVRELVVARPDGYVSATGTTVAAR